MCLRCKEKLHGYVRGRGRVHIEVIGPVMRLKFRAKFGRRVHYAFGQRNDSLRLIGWRLRVVFRLR